MANGLTRRRGRGGRDPMGGVATFHNQLDDMFGDLFRTDFPAANVNTPPMDVYTQDDDRLVVEVNLAGYEPDDVEVHVHDDVLEVIGDKTEVEENRDRRGRNYIVREGVSTFFRSIRLPAYVDTDNVEAGFDNAVLRIEIPFKESRPTQNIEILSDEEITPKRGRGRRSTARTSSRNGRSRERDEEAGG
jgi:HSP20 family protein